VYTSGWVVTLVDDMAQSNEAIAEFLAAGPFQLGERRGPCLTVVAEADGPEAAHAWHEWAESLPGVVSAEVVLVHWDEALEEVAHAGV